MSKHTIEVFAAGCSACQEVIDLVNRTFSDRTSAPRRPPDTPPKRLRARLGF